MQDSRAARPGQGACRNEEGRRNQQRRELRIARHFGTGVSNDRRHRPSCRDTAQGRRAASARCFPVPNGIGGQAWGVPHGRGIVQRGGAVAARRVSAAEGEPRGRSGTGSRGAGASDQALRSLGEAR